MVIINGEGVDFIRDIIMKKYSCKLICMLILVFLVTGCSSKNTVVNYDIDSDAYTKISFFGNKYEPENVTVIEEIIDSFMKENTDIRVSYESLKGEEYYEALEKRMAAGKGDDVFMVNHDTVLSLAGKLVDLSELETISGYADSMLEQMYDGDRIYWLPTTVSAFGLYCNLSLLKEHGQDVPDTLKEWEAVCEYFKNKGIVPVIANNDISVKTLAIGLGFFDAYQENRQNEAFDAINRGEKSLSSFLLPGFTLAERFVSKGYIDGDTALVTKKTSDDLKLFAEGKSPFMLTGGWAAGRVKGMDINFDFKVVPYPVLEDGSLLVINADTRLSVNADSENQEAAIRFVEFFTREDNIRKFADNQSSFSPLKDSKMPAMAEIQPLAECYRSDRIVIGTDGHLNLPIWDITADVSKRLLSGERAEAALEWMERQILNGEADQ